MTNHMQQIKAKDFHFSKYVSKKRWISFFHQIDEISSMDPESILEIGVGSGVTGIVFKNIFNKIYESMDIDCDLNPDHIGSVIEMPFTDNQFDVVGCFQVLEHLPYDDFKKSLTEIFRVAKKGVIISLPNSRKTLRQFFSRLFSKNIGKYLSRKIKQYKHGDQHYWEINSKGHSLKNITKIITNISGNFDFKLVKNYRVWENPFHHFFILKKQ